MPTILFAVTNDLNYDQRMARICSSLHQNGYHVVLIGCERPDSQPLQATEYEQCRLSVKHHSGKRFYIEYNRALYRYIRHRILQEGSADTAICAIDLDTILPVWLICQQHRSLIPVYDAHEYFTGMAEVIRRPWIKAMWKGIEKMTLPFFKHGYTVNQTIADLFKSEYGHSYEVIRNLPRKQQNAVSPNTPLTQVEIPLLPERFILYQGAVNEGRSFETLIPAMKKIPIPLVIAGEGNFFQQTKKLIRENNLEEKVILMGKVLPAQLQQITPKAALGLTLFSRQGINQVYSLANRFFDYLAAGIPQVCADFPEYQAINETWDIALLCQPNDVDSIANAVNKLLSDNVLYTRLQTNTHKASASLHWEAESLKLLRFWDNVFQDH